MTMINNKRNGINAHILVPYLYYHYESSHASYSISKKRKEESSADLDTSLSISTHIYSHMLHSTSYFYLARATALFAHTSTLPQLLVLAQHWNRHVSVASFIELV